jgi:hypothetical protein
VPLPPTNTSAKRVVLTSDCIELLGYLHDHHSWLSSTTTIAGVAVRRSTRQWVSFPSRPMPRLIAATLLEAITGRANRLSDQPCALGGMWVLHATEQRALRLGQGLQPSSDVVALALDVADLGLDVF